MLPPIKPCGRGDWLQRTGDNVFELAGEVHLYPVSLDPAKMARRRHLLRCVCLSMFLKQLAAYFRPSSLASIELEACHEMEDLT